ncbi:MAG: helix-turn-helix transcriptional regulator [Oscillospiraceae bacterium]|nr:helix-turn-helix transcriptional regulator [Oscillospiraceae bacterium]
MSKQAWGYEKKAERQARIVAQPTASMGDRMLLMRYRKRLSADAAAKEMGLTENSLLHWERDEYKPRVNELIIVAEYYGVTLDWIVLGRGGANASAGNY